VTATASKLKKFLAGALVPAGLEVVRGYVVRRVREISPDDLLDAIERGDTDLLGKLSDRDRRVLEMASRRFGKYLDYLNVRNVFEWLAEDLPFYAGILYGHPRGLKWLESVLEQIKSYARSLSPPPQNLSLVPVGETGEEAREGEGKPPS
jgi:hypothetical protein